MKKWKLKLSSLFIVLALVFTLGNTVQAATLDDLPLHLLETPTELSQLISSFSKLEYSMTMDEAGTVEEHTIEYEFLGVEEVNNVQADRGRIIPRGEMEEAAMNFWMADGEIVKLEMGGQEIPAEMAGMFANEMLDFVFLPFSFFNQADMDELEDENVRNIEIYTETIGDLELEVYEIELTNIDDFDSGFLRMAEYEGMLLLIGYDYYENGNEYNFTVNNIELR
ncbi:hypothetical protein I0Q91_01620 [Halanaerobiaceae bacterium Z-7014]|uniref:Outer membrane lipoprotein-sorting protein n=1 Tax=Halonatronomonas betaini TaxID=2778430 RepID=A0A931AT93_9FIRM|nr:hypothetical protein [Halonatronomonas betaini]MBF8435766.1 hypothetical protein [Halonatronomonas betaini]